MDAKMLELLQNHSSKYPAYLEAHFPHIFQKLLEVWNTAEAEAYFDELMLSKRADRGGFPPEATAEIWALHGIHSALRESQQAQSENTDIWSSGSDDAHHSRLLHDGGK